MSSVSSSAPSIHSEYHMSTVIFRRVSNEIMHYYNKYDSSGDNPPLIFLCTHGHSKTVGTRADHFEEEAEKENAPTLKAIDVTLYDPCNALPSIGFILFPFFPFRPPRVFVDLGPHFHSTVKRRTDYASYLQTSWKLIWSIRTKLAKLLFLLPSSSSSSLVLHKNAMTKVVEEVAAHTTVEKCLCCVSKTTTPNWKPTFHLVEIAKEFHDIYAKKKRFLHYLFTIRICRARNIPETIENCILEYFVQ